MPQFSKSWILALTIWSLAGAVIPAGPAQATPEPRVFQSIEVRGNTRFRDGDILATSGLVTGQLMSQDDLVAAVEALEYTGEFDEVTIASRGSVLVIEVHEAPQYSGGIGFGLGYDSADGVFGTAGLALDDIGTEGTRLRGALRLAEEARRLDLSFHRDDLWTTPGGGALAGGVRLGLEDYRYDDVLYHYRSLQVQPYVQRAVEGLGRFELRYTLRREEIHNIDPAASAILQSDAGQETGSGLGFSFITGSDDRAQDRLWHLRFDQDVFGLGGGQKISTSRLTLGGQAALGTAGFALRSTFEAGAVRGWGGDTPRASDRFALGGSQLRGFARGTITPRDICAGCAVDGGDQITPLGGNAYAALRTELLVPLLPRYRQLETFVFYDIGSSWDVETDTGPSGTLEDDQLWRSAVGIGAAIRTRLGTLESYYAIDSDGGAYDETQSFGLTLRSDF